MLLAVKHGANVKNNISNSKEITQKYAPKLGFNS
jgi:hypothetical protein